jgi:hypothetical protein
MEVQEEIEEKKKIDLASIKLVAKKDEKFAPGYIAIWFMDDPLQALFFERYFENSLELLKYFEEDRVVAVMLGKGHIDILTVDYVLGVGQQLHLWRADVI